MRRLVSVGAALVAAGVLWLVLEYTLLSQNDEIVRGAIKVVGRSDPFFPAATIAAVVAVVAGCALVCLDFGWRGAMQARFHRFLARTRRSVE